MAIADGQKIVIRFTQPLIRNVSGNESKFTVSFDEYNYIPGGSISRVTRSVSVIEQYDDKTIALIFDSGTTNSIQRAAGDITVSYDGSGTLIGEGGPVLAFERTFTPIGLDSKNNPHDVEHIGLDVTVNSALTRVYYTSSYAPEHIDLDVLVVGELTHVDDI